MNETFPAGVMTVSGLKVIAEKESARGWTLDGVLRRGSLAILAAPPKTGKSTLALELALSVFQGVDFLERATSQGRVLYIQAEDAPSVTWERLEKMLGEEKQDD